MAESNDPDYSDDPLLYLVQCKELLRLISDNAVVASADKSLQRHVDACRENLYKAMKILYVTTPGGTSEPATETSAEIPALNSQSWASQIQIGQFIECNYKCGDGWYRGKVTSIVEQNHKTYKEVEREVAVQYSFANNSGDSEVLPLHSTRPCGPTSLSMTYATNGAKARVGDLVDVLYKGDEGWFAAKIKSLRVTTADVPRVPTSYDVEYLDGEVEEDVPPAHVRFAWRPLDVIYPECDPECDDPSLDQQSPRKDHTKEKIAQFEDAEPKTTPPAATPPAATPPAATPPATVAAEPAEAAAAASESDSDSASGSDSAPPLPEAGQVQSAPTADHQTATDSVFEIGELVEALVSSQTHGARWFDAWIREVKADGSFDVEYADGHRPRFESGVSESRLRSKDEEANCVLQ